MSDYGPYQPAVPAGFVPGGPLPGPRRPRVRSVLGWTGLVVLLAGCGLETVSEISTETGVVGFVGGSLLAAVPVFPVVAVFLWLDRYESEPRSLLAFALAWGAVVATFGALVVNTASVHAIQKSGGDPTWGVLLVAPVVEESLKGLAVLLILLVRRREFDGVVDGIVYAGMAGVGFAFMENVLYLGRALGSTDGHPVFVFAVRCLASPFAHPLFTAATGVGIGIAASSSNRLLRAVAPVAGWCVAVALHSGWNLSASSGLRGFVSLYVLVQLPIFAAVAALAVLARQREGRLIARHLAVYCSTGWLSHDEVGMLASLRARRDSRAWARRVGGSAARRSMRDFQELGSELAFLRERMVRGAAPADAQEQEYAMLAAMSALRGTFLPQWVRPGVQV
ncbi:MAG TPA: PrsW family intramembrane metalloprotease [Kineosporiaceae bacterium]|nr:PrsW family intramembrane metalloprotease [Kineosporiaceae bacterium]